MTADKNRDCYDKAAKERMKAGGGDKKSGQENLPDPIPNRGKARDQAAKMVGVSGRTVDNARTVHRHGTPELAKAVNRIDARHSGYPLPLFDDLDLPTDVAQRHGQQRDADQQRPQAELIPAEFALRRLGLHGRIIPGRGQREQAILDSSAPCGRTRAAGLIAVRRRSSPHHRRSQDGADMASACSEAYSSSSGVGGSNRLNHKST
jgi:hypothetical protein